MTGYTLDTNIVRPILRNDRSVLDRVAELLREGASIQLNALTYYETKRGLLAANASRQLQRFDRLCQELGVLMIDQGVLDTASELYADLRRKGALIEDADLFIAAIALENRVCLVTNNKSHFERIEGLELEDWLRV